MINESLRVYPGYHYALAILARAKAAQGLHTAAAALYSRRYEIAPHPENLFDVAVALSAAGDLHGAKRAFAEFEQAARAEMNTPDNSNRELALYYADYARNFAEALRIARREAEARQDVHTLEVYAWVLHRSGARAEATSTMRKVLATGVKSPAILAHAAEMALAESAEVAHMPHNRSERDGAWQTSPSGSQSH
ncbi:MAG TPA: hypothetical protein VFL57_22135 [Bryobacteraceae bacterium]|nr:hypothetical protein [Bryobacteraceae bacterium]